MSLVVGGAGRDGSSGSPLLPHLQLLPPYMHSWKGSTFMVMIIEIIVLVVGRVGWEWWFPTTATSSITSIIEMPLLWCLHYIFPHSACMGWQHKHGDLDKQFRTNGWGEGGCSFTATSSTTCIIEMVYV